MSRPVAKRFGATCYKPRKSSRPGGSREAIRSDLLQARQALEDELARFRSYLDHKLARFRSYIEDVLAMFRSYMGPVVGDGSHVGRPIAVGAGLGKSSRSATIWLTR